jgi:hypothetical protein
MYAPLLVCYTYTYALEGTSYVRACSYIMAVVATAVARQARPRRRSEQERIATRRSESEPARAPLAPATHRSANARSEASGDNQHYIFT